MTYQKQRNRWIWLLVILPIVGILRFLVSILFFTIDVSTSIPTAPVDINQGSEIGEMLDPFDGSDDIPLIHEWWWEQTDDMTEVIKNFVNRALWIIALLWIPWTIYWIYLLASNKKDEEKKTNWVSNEESWNNHSVDTKTYIEQTTKEVTPYTWRIYKDTASDILQLWRDTLSSKRKRISVWQYFVASSVLSIATIGLSALYYLITPEIITWDFDILGFILIVLPALVAMILNIMVTIYRFADLDRHRSHIFFLLIPFYNIYIMFVLGTREWTSWPNKYGEDPLIYQPKTNNWYRGIIILSILLEIASLFGSGTEGFAWIDNLIETP